MSIPYQFMLGSRSSEALKALRDLVNSSEYTKGGRLPNEADLCRRFNVSRTTIRRAVACLVGEGLVVVRKRAGMFVLGSNEKQQRRIDAATVAVMGGLDLADMRHLQELALESNHLICSYSQSEAHWNSNQELKFLKRVTESHHCGLIAFLSPLDPRNEQLVSVFAAEGLRVVHVEYSGLVEPSENYRLCDYRQAGRVAAIEFLMAGYRNMAFVRVTNAPYEVLLEEGFAAALREHGPGFSEERNRLDARRTPQGPPDGQSRMQACLQNQPKDLALLCPNNLVLNDLLAYARGKAWSIPNELGVIVLQFGRVPYHPDIDSLMYDRANDYRKALVDILAPSWERRQCLTPVVIERRGSVRGRPPSG